jgi:predicted metal-binding protein
MSESIDGKVESLLKDSGFSHWGPMDPSTLKARTEVRDTCATGKCNVYGKNWACPPACGTLEECAKAMTGFSDGVLLQTTVKLEDEFDIEAMNGAAEEHGKRLRKFAKDVRKIHPDAVVLGSGTCRVCEECAYPDKCRFPEQRLSSMEAFGLVVSDVCQANSLPYYYGPLTLTYTSCAMY